MSYEEGSSTPLPDGVTAEELNSHQEAAVEHALRESEAEEARQTQDHKEDNGSGDSSSSNNNNHSGNNGSDHRDGEADDRNSRRGAPRPPMSNPNDWYCVKCGNVSRYECIMGRGYDYYYNLDYILV